jgi:hypothetical protein
VTTYAAAIAARLQGREDEDMGKDESVPVTARTVRAFAEDVARELERLTTVDAPARELRVAELERQLAAQTKQATIAKDQVDEAWTRQSELEAQLAERERQLREAQAAAQQYLAERDTAWTRLSEANEATAKAKDTCPDPNEHDHGDCYVLREVPWADVAAGMMTIARDGTPWMVESCDMAAPGREVFVLRNGEKTFVKTPAKGETVRVLVPYVTPEQAASLVRDELGGREVS